MISAHRHFCNHPLVYGFSAVTLSAFCVGNKWKILQVTAIGDTLHSQYPAAAFMPTLVCFSAAFLSVWLCYSVMLGLLLQKRLPQLLLLDGFTFLPFLFPAAGIGELSDAVICFLAAKTVVLCGLSLLNHKLIFNKLIFWRKDICALFILSVSLLAFYLPSFVKRYSHYYSETTDFCFSVHLMNIIKHMDIPIWAA
ncbi:MAG: hypothetical protein GY850_16965, partial [bacterium]|nr:hypothetical protein [bacterium]